MASENETQEDIIAEMRKKSNKVRTMTRPDGYGGYEEITLEGNPYLASIAARLEAAYQRDSQSWQGTIRKLTAAIAEQGEENRLMRHALERVRRNLSMTYHDEEEERNLIVEAFNVAGNALLATEKKAEEKGAYDEQK